MPRSQRHMRDNPTIYPSDSGGQRYYGVPKDIALSAATVTAAAAANTVVGNLSTTDPDNQTGHTYSLQGQSVANKFKIVGNQVQVATTGLGTGTRTIVVRSTDPMRFFTEKTFTITVT